MIACVPASTSPTTRTCGNAPTPSPRPLLDRPNAWLAGLSGTSRQVHHHNPPVPVPRAPRLVGRQRPRSLLEQQPQRLRPQPGAGSSRRRCSARPVCATTRSTSSGGNVLVSAPSAIRSVIGGGEGSRAAAAGAIRLRPLLVVSGRSGHYHAKAANRMALPLAGCFAHEGWYQC